MFKMKRKFFHGGVALCLATMMVVSTVVPVWAEAMEEINTAPYKTWSSGEATLSNEDGYNNLTHAYEGDSQTMDVRMDRVTTYNIRIPKTVTFEGNENNTRKDATHTFTWGMSYDIPYSQTMIVSVNNVDLSSKRGNSTQTRKLNVTGITNDESAINASVSTNSVTINNTTDGSDPNNDSYEKNLKKFTCTLKNAQDINAGNWKGTMTFTIVINGTE